MGLTLKVEGQEPIELGVESLTKMVFASEIPQDSNARSTNIGATITIEGRILTPLNGDPGDNTMKLYKWSLVPAEKADCYRNFTVNALSASQVVRTITMPNAFVVDYTEDFGDTEGAGKFKLVVRQKKNLLKDVQINGGYPA